MLGTVRYGSGGPQGASAASGAILPVTLPVDLPADATAITGTTAGGTGLLDSLLLTPLVSQLVTSGGNHALALLNSVSARPEQVQVDVPGSGPATVVSYDQDGIARTATLTPAGTIAATVLPGGFTLITR